MWNLTEILVEIIKAGGKMFFDGDTDAGFLVAQLVGNVYRTDNRQLFAKYEYGLQIIFCGFIVVHWYSSGLLTDLGSTEEPTLIIS